MPREFRSAVYRRLEVVAESENRTLAAVTTHQIVLRVREAVIMCLLSVYINNDPAAKYRVILASNRDEFYNRKAKALVEWVSAKGVRCFSGRDFEPGREGGTWLGISELGKIGVLLNVRESEIDMNAKPRGK